jgi:hypothetical protein
MQIWVGRSLTVHSFMGISSFEINALSVWPLQRQQCGCFKIVLVFILSYVVWSLDRRMISLLFVWFNADLLKDYPFIVIPAKAGIHLFNNVSNEVDPSFRWGGGTTVNL